jgi:GH24 family phage-related lysozyme (muramidase)
MSYPIEKLENQMIDLIDEFYVNRKKIGESYYEDKEKERQKRQFRFSTMSTPEKKYWFKPDGTVAEAGYSHEEWIKNNDSSLVGDTLVDTYDNAIRKGYVRAVLDMRHNFLTISNLENYDFSMNGNKNVPAVKSNVLDAIRNFIAEKSILITATGKGDIIKDLTNLDESKLTEGWKDWVAAGAIGLGALTGNVDASKVKQTVPIVQTAIKSGESSLLNKKTSDYIAHWEGMKDTVYKDTENKPTIGIGHYLNNSQEDRNLFKSLFGDAVNYDKVLNGQQKLSKDQIEKLFNVDVKIKEKLASIKISNFNSLPISVKNAVINALYRGDLGPKTITLMNNGNWGSAAKEYLNHKNARSGPEQIKRRMNTNALAFAQFAKNKS